MVRRVLIVFALVASACAFLPTGDERNSRLINRIKSLGYPAELHEVTTRDGYVLNMHRVPYGRDGSAGKRPVVFLMHGIMSTSSHYLYLGPEYALAYNLADAGYDVWMGNQRGNFYSRKHISLNPDDSREKLDFFDYSWEEVGTIDIPAMVDYALAYTGQEKLHYVGHSQGGTVFLVLASMNPEFNDKFASAHLLAGVGYKDNFPFAPLKRIADLTSVIYTLGRSLGIVEISYDALPLSEQVKIEENGVVDYCVGNEQYKAYCELTGVNYLLDSKFLNIPDMGGTSIKQLAHFGQNIKDSRFRRWNHGALSNLLAYGSLNPPAYDLSKITVDVTMHYTVGDIILSEDDVLAMAAAMPNASVRKVEKETFRHASFLFSKDVKELVTDYIIEKLDQSLAFGIKELDKYTSIFSELKTLTNIQYKYSLLHISEKKNTVHYIRLKV